MEGDVYRAQQDKFFNWIVYIFITAVVSGLWVWIAMNLSNNTYFHDPMAAALLVGMITTSAGVVIVIFSSKLFYGWLEDKMEEGRLRRKVIKTQKMQYYKQQYNTGADPYNEVLGMMQQLQERLPQTEKQPDKDLNKEIGIDITRLQ